MQNDEMQTTAIRESRHAGTQVDATDERNNIPILSEQTFYPIFPIWMYLEPLQARNLIYFTRHFPYGLSLKPIEATLVISKVLQLAKVLRLIVVAPWPSRSCSG